MMWQAATVGARRLLHCAFQATKSEKCQGNFFTVFHMQRGKEEGEKKPHAAFKAGKEANWSTILRMLSSKAPMLGTSSCALPSGGSLWIQKSLCLKQQKLVHLHPPRWKTLGTDRGRGAGRTHSAYATEVCSQACCWWDAHVAAVQMKAQLCRRIARPSAISEGPRCSPEVSWLDGSALLESQ